MHYVCLFVLGSLVFKEGRSVSESFCLHPLSIQNVLYLDRLASKCTAGQLFLVVSDPHRANALLRDESLPSKLLLLFNSGE